MTKSIAYSNNSEQSTESHCIDDYQFDIEIEKKFLDTYFYRKEDDRKLIKLPNYDISEASTFKQMVSKIQNKVVYESESTEEVKEINYTDDLNFIISEKQKYNKLIDSDPARAIQGYLKTLEEIEFIFSKIKDPIQYEKNQTLKEMNVQFKFISSNVALAYEKLNNYAEAIQWDKRILNFDPKFDKSVARLIKNFCVTNNLVEAQKYVDYLNHSFDSKTRERYENIFAFFREHDEKHSQMLRAKMQNYKNNESKEKVREEKKHEEMKRMQEEIIQNTSTEISRPSKRSGILGAIFGGLILIASSASLFVLYKFRYRFSK